MAAKPPEADSKGDLIATAILVILTGLVSFSIGHDAGAQRVCHATDGYLLENYDCVNLQELPYCITPDENIRIGPGIPKQITMSLPEN